MMWWVRAERRSEPGRETLTEAYEVRAFRDEEEAPAEAEPFFLDVVHPEPGTLQATKSRVLGHGEQAVIPDDCQFGDNDMCYVDA